VRDFLYGKDVTPTKQVAALSHKVRRRNALSHLPLTATLSSNVVAERADAARLGFTAEFPSVQDQSGSATLVNPQCTTLVQDCIRNYEIHAPNGRAYPAYVEVFSNGQLGQFYDVQGTTWTNAPLFPNPTQTIRVGKRSYNLYYDGSHITTIAWREYGAVYWVHNTLTDAVSNGELLAIAEQTAPIGAVRSASAAARHGRGKRVILKAFSVPTYHAKVAPTPEIQSIGQIGGLVTLVALPLGLLALYLNRRRLGIVRDHVNAATATAGAVETRLVAAGAYRPAFAPGGARYGGPAAGARYGGAPGHHRSRRAAIALTIGIMAILAGGGAYLALRSGVLKSTTKPRVQQVPTAPVAVLNAGQTAHAAHDLALKLTRQHVRVIDTGNLASTAPATLEVLYARGEAPQARLLAAMLQANHPTVAPITAVTAHAVGSAPKLVVVIP